MKLSLPSRRALLVCLSIWVVYLVFCQAMIGIRFEHVFFFLLFLACFIPTELTRKFAMCMIPFVLFGISYDVMRLYPNYLVNEVDIQGIHDAELSLFGVTDGGVRMTLNEYFALHNSAVADFFAGIFYLLWVPAPLVFCFYYFFKGDRAVFLHFTWAFLFINLLGFVGYYVHPASPPWFFAQHGGSIDPSMLSEQLGSEAGLARFDALIGSPVFHGIYGRNANVFAAVPSLHSTYCLCTFLYALKGHAHVIVTTLLGILSLGICWTAVYTSHHYLIDVLLGVSLCLGFVLLWEKVILRWGAVSRLEHRYVNYIK